MLWIRTTQDTKKASKNNIKIYLFFSFEKNYLDKIVVNIFLKIKRQKKMNTCLCAGNSLKVKPQNKMKIKKRKNKSVKEVEEKMSMFRGEI